MNPIRSRLLTLCIGVVLLFALSSIPAEAASCHTDCAPKFWPECMSCGFTAFSSVRCVRESCGQCAEMDCFVMVRSSQGDQLAASDLGQEGCTVPSVSVPKLTIVKVQHLAGRS